MPIRAAVETVTATCSCTEVEVPGTTGKSGPLSWLKRTVPPGEGFLFLMTDMAAFSTASGKLFAKFFAGVGRSWPVWASLGRCGPVLVGLCWCWPVYLKPKTAS